jgi:hypothetical protein
MFAVDAMTTLKCGDIAVRAGIAHTDRVFKAKNGVDEMEVNEERVASDEDTSDEGRW